MGRTVTIIRSMLTSEVQAEAACSERVTPDGGIDGQTKVWAVITVWLAVLAHYDYVPASMKGLLSIFSLGLCRGQGGGYGKAGCCKGRNGRIGCGPLM